MIDANVSQSADLKHYQVGRYMMKSALSIAILVIMISLSGSCESDDQEPAISNSITIPEYEISIADSFGVELGDSLNMIGSINGLCNHPDGSILLLDRSSLRIRVITTEGDSYLISRRGDGPGELLLPQAICALHDGRILVSDEMKQEVMSFDIAGNYLGSYFTTDRYVPLSMYPLDSSSIAGLMMKLEMSDEEIIFSSIIGRFDASSIPSVVFNSREWIWPAPEMYTEINLIDFTADCEGNVFIAVDNTEYHISVYTPNGTELLQIERDDVNRMPKSPEEIQAEIDDFEEWAVQDQAYTGGYEPSPFYQLISLAGTDAEGNLWVVRHDSDIDYLFDIWNRSGDMIYTARLYRNEKDPGLFFSVDQIGIIAAISNSSRFERVYTLDIDMPADGS